MPRRRGLRHWLIWAAVLAICTAGPLMIWATLISEPHHDYINTAHCLDTSSHTDGLSDQVDYLAQEANLAATTNVAGNHLTVIDTTGSSGIAAEYRTIGAGKVEQHGNLLYVWDAAPTAGQENIANGCLR